MSSVRDGLEQAVLVSIGAAALTRDRAEAAVADLVRRGQMGAEEGGQAVERLLSRLKAGGEGGASSGLVGKLEGGVQGVLREVGAATRADLHDLGQRMDELEHRVSLLEADRDQPAEAGQG